MTNIYLDIDGVLLDGDHPTAGADKFIQYVTTRFPATTYWLSGRCSGDADATLTQLQPHFASATMSRLALVHPTRWALIKTEAIDFDGPFLWFDDALGVEDEAVLEQHGAIGSFVHVDLFDEPERLHQLVADFPKP